MLFNEIYYRIEKNLLNQKDGKEILRQAVRAVIMNGNKILMANLEKTGEFKFPGGGVKENETLNEALKREVLEEVGFKVIKIIEKIGIITEFDKAKEGKNYFFKMTSVYFLVEIENVQLKQNLEKDEEELMYKPCWIDIKEALVTNKNLIVKNMEKTPGIYRETMALEKIIEKYKL